MNNLVIAAVCFYFFSAAGYAAYLFLQKDVFERTAFYILTAGFVCHTAGFVYSAVKTGMFPIHNLQDIMLLAVWTVAGVFIFFQYVFKLKILGIYTAPFLSFAMLTVSWSAVKPAESKTVFTNLWLFAHIISIFIGEAWLALGCGIGILYLIQERSIKRKKLRFFFKRLPSLEMLDNTGYICVLTGFLFFSLGLLAGFGYSEIVLGKFLACKSREFMSLATWGIYAVFLLQCFISGRQGKRTAFMSVLGFAAVLFTTHF